MSLSLYASIDAGTFLICSYGFWPYITWKVLTHWGRVTHIGVGNLTIIGSDNGLSPGRWQAITWSNVGILLIWPLGANFSEMLIEIHTFSFKKIHSKILSEKWRPSCLGLNVLISSSINRTGTCASCYHLYDTVAPHINIITDKNDI